MAQRILIVSCPCWGVSQPPLGLASLASYLRGKGLQADILDLNIEIWRRATPQVRLLWEGKRAPRWWFEESFREEILPVLQEELRRAAERIARDPAEVIGFSVFVSNRLFTRELIAQLRRSCDKTIIVGGRGVYDPIERLQFPEGLVDFFYVGEGEASLHLFLQGQADAPGIIRAPGTPVQPVYLARLEELPFIDYEGFDLAAYAERSLCVQMTRGCSFSCAFCNDWRYIGRRRSRGGRILSQEIERHHRESRITNFIFNDQAINVDRRELHVLCHALATAPFGVEWTAMAIPSRSLDLDLLQQMRAAGCTCLSFGVESGSPHVLGLMNKRLQIDEVEQVLRDTRQAGINTVINLIVGFPGETEEDFQQTIEFVARNKQVISGVGNANTCDVILGSDLHLDQDRFGVAFPDLPEGKYRAWTFADGGNDPEVRRRRLRLLLEQLEACGIGVWTSNGP